MTCILQFHSFDGTFLAGKLLGGCLLKYLQRRHANVMDDRQRLLLSCLVYRNGKASSTTTHSMTAIQYRSCTACRVLLLHLVTLLSWSSLAPFVVNGQELGQRVPCLRWAHQSTVAQNEGGDGHSIWIYGGRARTALGQALNSELNASIITIMQANLHEG